MKKVESAPVLEHSQEELGTGAHANPLRAKIAAKRAAALEKQKKVEMTEAAVNLEVAVKEEEPGPEAEPAAVDSKTLEQPKRVGRVRGPQ